MTRERAKNVAYWITTIFGPASFVIGGVLHLLLTPDVVATLRHLGYPTYFALILGVGKLLGAVAIVIPRFPRLKEWAYAGFFFDLSAAAFSRAAVGDSAVDIIAPLVFLSLVMASWALRPDSRRLASPIPASNPADLSHSILDAERPRRASSKQETVQLA
jgi:uncharacterized membrane protein YphA (DoxX/SURF4 family)